MSEQRTTERSRTFLRGRIEYNGGQTSLECLIRDLSDTGARIMLSEAVVLPQTFRLFIPKTGEWHGVTVRWRRGDALGLLFDAVPGEVEAPVAIDPVLRVRELEAEVVKLRRVLEELRADPSRIHILLDSAV